MAKIGIATNKRIIELIKMMRDGTLILRPRFQRNLVWNNKHKEAFIDTITKGLPFPEIYFADGDIDLEKQVSTTLLVDGQQRLDTIFKYIGNSKDLEFETIRKFSDLTPTEQTNFLDYNVVVRDLGRIDDVTIKEIFNRINSVQYALNAVEINNALYEGEYITTAKEIIDSKILDDLNVFYEDESARMKDLEFVLLAMTTIEVGGYFARNAEVEEYIKKNDDKYPTKVQTKKIIIDTLYFIKSIGLNPDSIWLRKSSFFTLMIELIKYKTVHNCFPIGIKDLLNNLEKHIISNKNESITTNEFAKFYKYIYQGTTNRNGRIIRGELLEKYLNQNVP